MKNATKFILIMLLLNLPGFSFKANAQRTWGNLEAEKKAIKQVIEKQTRLYFQKDFRNYQSVWSHEPYVIRMLNGERISGWENVGRAYQHFMAENPEPVPYQHLVQSDYKFRIYDDVAWVSHKQGSEGNPTQYNIRLLEKENPQWKIVYKSNTSPPRHELSKEKGEWKVVYHNSFPYQGTVSFLTGSKLWEKVIAYHDPEGNWATFRGKVKLITTMAGGNRVNEILEVRRPEDFYQCTRFVGDVKAVKGIKKDECFYHVNGNPNPPEEEINEYNIDCEGARIFKEHHTGHFGLPMALREAGVIVKEEVERVNFQAESMYALQFTGNPETVAHPYYAGAWTLYIDPETYAVRGIRTDVEQGNELFEYLSLFEGELEVGGIKMPQVKVGYKNGSFWHNDAFSSIKD